MPCIEVALEHVLPIEDEDMVLRVHAEAAQASDDPSIREGLRPGEIHFVLGPGALRTRRRGHRPANHNGAHQRGGRHDFRNNAACGYHSSRSVLQAWRPGSEILSSMKRMTRQITRPPIRSVAGAGIALAAILAASRASAQTRVTFTRDVAPILFEHCAECHRPGEI